MAISLWLFLLVGFVALIIVAGIIILLVSNK